MVGTSNLGSWNGHWNIRCFFPLHPINPFVVEIDPNTKQIGEFDVYIYIYTYIYIEICHCIPKISYSFWRTRTNHIPLYSDMICKSSLFIIYIYIYTYIYIISEYSILYIYTYIYSHNLSYHIVGWIPPSGNLTKLLNMSHLVRWFTYWRWWFFQFANCKHLPEGNLTLEDSFPIKFMNYFSQL